VRVEPRIDQTMIAELARFTLGRVLLHFIAMLRDGAVRFHAAGIARELSRIVGGAAPLFARVHAGIPVAKAKHDDNRTMFPEELIR
jgi:hypothetical protein